MKFIQEQLADFKAFKAVQESGEFNMFDPRARAASGLDRAEFRFVLKNYDDLKKAVSEDQENSSPKE